MDKNINSYKFMELSKIFIVDFDSTFVQIESLDKLAEIVLDHSPKKEKILNQIKQITEKAMLGKISFTESLLKRLKLFRPNRGHIDKLIRILKKQITISVLRNKKFFKKYRGNIFIVSGGFKEYIVPVVKQFGIRPNHVFANTFIFSQKRNIIGFNENNLLAQEKGKVKQIKKLNLKEKLYIIGDGYTDYQIKEAGLAHKFYLFCENIKRTQLINKADNLLNNFDEFIHIFNL